MRPPYPSRIALSIPLAAGIAAAILSACVATAPTVDEQSAPAPQADANKLLVVDCLLPGQIRKLGQAMTYLSARRPIKTTAGDCEIRGGEYVAYDRTNYATALKVWLPPAQEGDPAAQTYVGEIYEKGLGLTPDYTLAVQWYRKAADQGYSRAQINLGFLYEKGLGVPKDPKTALDWYRKASGLTNDNLAFTSSTQAVETERDELRRELALRNKEADSLRAQLKQTQEQLQSRRNRLESTQRELEETRRQLQQPKPAPPSPAADATTQQLQQRLAEQQAVLEKQNQEFAYLQQQAELQQAQLKTELRAAEQRAKGLQENVTSQAKQRDSLQQQVEYLQKQLATYQEQLNARKQELANQRSSLQQTQQAIERQQRSPQPSPDNAELQRLRQQLSTKNNELNQSQQQIAKLEADVKRRQEELEKLKSVPAESPALVSRAGSTTLNEPEPVAKPQTPKLDFGRYFALVIGNNRYGQFPNLETAVNDANAVAKVLKSRYGFETRVLTNAKRYDILSALNEFRGKLTEKDNFLLYYAGHGELDRANDQGNWLPVDAEPTSNANWISNSAITEILNAMTAKHIMVIADSCYSGTMARSVTTSTEGGRSDEKRLVWLSHMINQRSRTVLTSGGLKPVLDSGGGNHSLFARALLEVLETNKDVLESPLLYRQVAKQVKAAAVRLNVDQDPRYGPLKFAGDLGAPFFFNLTN